MDTVGSSAKIWSFLDGEGGAVATTNATVRRGAGRHVTSYLDLAAKVAELQYRNRNHVLLFRGQIEDHKNVGQATTLKPSIFRPIKVGKTLSDATLRDRFRQLSEAEELLAAGWAGNRKLGRQRVQRERFLRWSILQHYEVCPTPLLDVTSSLRICASFGALTAARTAFVYVLAVPNVSGALTASAEAGIEIVRLASVCPPSALRAHIQEGYLLGEFPEMVSASQANFYKHYEIDLGRRLVAKFHFRPDTFSKDEDFPLVGHRAIYPKTRDWLEELTSRVKASIGTVA